MQQVEALRSKQKRAVEGSILADMLPSIDHHPLFCSMREALMLKNREMF
jgi:hypothetical protein